MIQIYPLKMERYVDVDATVNFNFTLSQIILYVFPLD